MTTDVINTVTPYEEINREDIQYTYCTDYNHLSRYRTLRNVVHEGSTNNRYVALETFNPFETNADVTYYTVPDSRENRLDLIAQEFLGSPNYSWVIAYYNHIDDGFTCLEGTTLAIPKSISSLFETGELLAPISASKLNLGSE